MAPRINWLHKVKALGYESLPVMLLDFVKDHGLQRAAVGLGVSESSLYFKMRGLGLGFRKKKIWGVYPAWPYVAEIWKARRRGKAHA